MGRGPRAVGRGPPGRGPAFSKTRYQNVMLIWLKLANLKMVLPDLQHEIMFSSNLFGDKKPIDV